MFPVKVAGGKISEKKFINVIKNTDKKPKDYFWTWLHVLTLICVDFLGVRFEMVKVGGGQVKLPLPLCSMSKTC